MLTCPACGRTSPAEASFCMGCGVHLGATSSSREVRKTVTALFCDLVGSTTLGETHDPEVLRPLLERYFTAARGAVERHGGRVEKFIGDAVSAVFGLPAAHEDDALRAVRAAMEIQERLAALTASSPFPFAARIGVTTGEVLVPGDGTPIIGDAMNTAARLQAGAEPGTVLIGEPTYRLVRDAVVAEPVEPLALRGKAEPVPAYRVLQVASLSPMRTRRLDAPMVGRRREAALLESAYERAASDRACQLFTVLGSAGAGKSRLVEEFLAGHAADDGDAEILRGRCLPYGEGITWYPVTEALRGGLGLPDFADAKAVRFAIHAAVGDLEHAPAIEANLARLFAAGESGSPEETFWAIRRFLESRGREHPLVLVLDDIHWGEATFLDFVEHVADWSRDASILLLAMARPDLLDVRPAWGGGKTNATTISLAPLSDAECGTLLAGLLGSSALPREVRDRITAVAEGNPLFLEEMLRMLVDDGRLVREGTGDGEQWVAAGDLADIHVPPTIRALLSARLDRLSDPERAVVGAAAVEGKSFHRGAVAALLPEAARSDLAVHLRSLLRRELVTPERSSLPGEDAYRFRHQLIRDAAYDAIPKADRAALHRAFADWLEGVAGDRAVEQEAFVGHHLAEAHRYREQLGLPEDRELRLRAAKALGSAGARALDAGDVGAAVELLRPAADLAKGDLVELENLERLQVALRMASVPEAASINDRLAATALAAGDPVYQTRARMQSVMSGYNEHPETWEPEAARALVEEALRTYREHAAPRFIPQTLSYLWDIELARGDMTRLSEAVGEALDVAMEIHDRWWIGMSLAWALIPPELGPTPLSAALGRATELVERLRGEGTIEAVVVRERAVIAAFLGRTDQAREDMARSRAIVDGLGRRADEANDFWAEGYIAWSDTDHELAEARFREASRRMGELGGREGLGWSEPPLARIMLDLGRDLDAEQLLANFRDNRVHTPARIAGAGIAAVIAARRGDLDEALRFVGGAEAFAATTNYVIEQADIALDKAEILLLAGRTAEARAAAEDALDRHTRKEYAIGARRARTFLAALPG